LAPDKLYCHANGQQTYKVTHQAGIVVVVQ